MEKISYEDATKELTIILNKLEGGQVTLEESLQLVERGKILISICHETLLQAKGKLTEIKETLGKLEEV